MISGNRVDEKGSWEHLLAENAIQGAQQGDLKYTGSIVPHHSVDLKISQTPSKLASINDSVYKYANSENHYIVDIDLNGTIALIIHIDDFRDIIEPSDFIPGKGGLSFVPGYVLYKKLKAYIHYL